MVYRRALIQELVVTMLAVFTVLLAIAMVTIWVRFLGQAAAGALAAEAVMVLLGFGTVSTLPVLLTVTVFVAVLLTLSRMSRDSEMVVWQTAGLGATAWIPPILKLCVPIVLFIALVTTVLAPWAIRKSVEYRQELERREDISAVAPGVFKESKHSERVYFVESLGYSNSQLNNIFVRSEQHGKLGVMIAKEGSQMITPNGDRYLVLSQGRRYEGLAGQADYRIMQFQRYTVRVEPYEARLGAPSMKAKPVTDLLSDRSRENMAEAHWRLGLPVTALLLVLLAVPLSFVNPRSGRSFHLVVALLIYAIYSNLLSISHAWVIQGKLSPWAGVWSVHIAMGLLITVLYQKRPGLGWQLPWRRA